MNVRWPFNSAGDLWLDDSYVSSTQTDGENRKFFAKIHPELFKLEKERGKKQFTSYTHKHRRYVWPDDVGMRVCVFEYWAQTFFPDVVTEPDGQRAEQRVRRQRIYECSR